MRISVSGRGRFPTPSPRPRRACVSARSLRAPTCNSSATLRRRAVGLARRDRPDDHSWRRLGRSRDFSPRLQDSDRSGHDHQFRTGKTQPTVPTDRAARGHMLSWRGMSPDLHLAFWPKKRDVRDAYEQVLSWSRSASFSATSFASRRMAAQQSCMLSLGARRLIAQEAGCLPNPRRLSGTRNNHQPL